MSVWASFGGLDDDGGYDEEPFDREPPIVYRKSHVLPSSDDPRGGHISLAAIPAFLTRDGYDDGHEDGRVWPYLRLTVRPAGTEDSDTEDTVVLDAEQVTVLAVDLLGWLARVDRRLA